MFLDLTMAESLIKSNHWNDFYWVLLQRKLSLIRVYTQVNYLIWRVWAHVQQFYRLLDKFEVWISCWCEAVCNIFDQFFCLIYGIQPFARFTEYRIYNNWNWFVLWWWRTLGSENMQIPATLFDKITSFWSVLNRGWRTSPGGTWGAGWGAVAPPLFCRATKTKIVNYLYLLKKRSISSSLKISFRRAWLLMINQNIFK